MEGIIDFKMNADEKAEFDKSVEAVRALVSTLKTVQ
jgi:malate dehydrogenase